MIFKVIQLYKNVKEGMADPTGFGRGQLLDIVKAFFIPFFIIGILALVLFALLGFGDALSIGPYGFFRVVFWIGLFVFLIWAFFAWFVFLIAKKFLNKAKKKVDDHFSHDVTPR